MEGEIKKKAEKWRELLELPYKAAGSLHKEFETICLCS